MVVVHVHPHATTVTLEPILQLSTSFKLFFGYRRANESDQEEKRERLHRPFASLRVSTTDCVDVLVFAPCTKGKQVTNLFACQQSLRPLLFGSRVVLDGQKNEVGSLVAARRKVRLTIVCDLTSTLYTYK